MSLENELTEKSFWDDYWSEIKLPLEQTKNPDTPYINAILGVFDQYLPRQSGLTVLEVGGAPGQYLAYLYRTFGYELHCLDYSELGCVKTRENFDLLGIPGEVHQRDFFAGELGLPLYDVVFSLGFVEHFADLEDVVGRHLALVKPGGTLLLGLPSFLGVNKFFMRRLAPELLAAHNLDTMHLDRWRGFEERFHLKTLFKGYVGGFEPAIFERYPTGRTTITNRALFKVASLLRRHVTDPFEFLRKFNYKYTSGYAMGVYTKTGD